MVAGTAYSKDGSVSEVPRSEKVFETVIEKHLLANGYIVVDRDSFDRDRAIFADAVLVLK